MTVRLTYLYLNSMTISVSLPESLVIKIKEAAQRDHRSISGQIAFFCDQGMSAVWDPQLEESPNKIEYGRRCAKKSES